MELIRPALDPRAYLGVIYSLARLPLALFYFVLLVVGISLSFSLVWVVGVGIPIFLLLLGITWWAVVFERELGAWWFGFRLRPMATSLPPSSGFWARLGAFIRNPVTWKALAFAALQVPIGFAIGLGFLAGITLALGLVAAPFLFVIGALSAQPGDPSYNALGLGDSPATLPLLVVFGALGVAIGIGLLHAGRAVVVFYQFLARTMLGVSQAQLDLATAQTAVVHEQKRADRSEQDRRQLVVNMGHEIRTPIASIRGHAEALLDGAGKPSEEETRRYLEVIQRETERLGALVDDLLVVARGEAGELRLDLRPVDVSAVAGEVVAALHPIALRDRQVKLVAQLPDAGTQLPAAWADRDRLTQVLMNLVRNAIAYTPEGGIVSVSVGASGDRVDVAVADTGLGIAAEELPKIFDRFYRADESRSRATGGFGLGLAISRDLVVAMAGTIDVESEPGTGSRFTVRLRAVQPEVAR
jgi:two-component system, OmpR family, phosphate regulon sensor histidine kinase PhoR